MVPHVAIGDGYERTIAKNIFQNHLKTLDRVYFAVRYLTEDENEMVHNKRRREPDIIASRVKEAFVGLP